MANSTHANLTGSDLHEPKGVDTASANQVYVTDGAGSGTHKKISSDEITGINALNQVVLTLHIENLSSAGDHYVVSPYSGSITTIYSVINGATGGSNEILTAKIGGTAVTDGKITITASGSAAGDVDVTNPTGLNTVTTGQAIEIENAGNPANVIQATITIVLDIS